MNSVVCIAQVPDTEARIKIGGDGRSIDEAGLKFIVSPFDEFALESAIRLKEAQGGDVTLISFGPDRVQTALREGLARGATKAMHIKGESTVDSLVVAKVLAAAIKSIPHDIVFFGKQGVGTDNSLVGPMVAEILGYAQINVVTEINVADGKVNAHREVEGAIDVIEAPLPAVVTAEKSKNEPRFAGIKGIMAAKKIAIESKSAADLGVTDAKPAVVWTKLELPKEKTAGRKVDGSDPAAAAKEILKFIREEAKAL